MSTWPGPNELLPDIPNFNTLLDDQSVTPTDFPKHGIVLQAPGKGEAFRVDSLTAYLRKNWLEYMVIMAIPSDSGFESEDGAWDLAQAMRDLQTRYEYAEGGPLKQSWMDLPKALLRLFVQRRTVHDP